MLQETTQVFEGTKYWSWVHMKGFVETEMQDLRFWTRLSAVLFLGPILGSAATFGCRYWGQELRGHPLILWSMTQSTEVVMILSFNRMQSSEVFKRAAVHYGYSHTPHLHEGSLQRFAICQITGSIGLGLVIFLITQKLYTELYVMSYTMFGYSAVMAIGSSITALSFSTKSGSSSSSSNINGDKGSPGPLGHIQTFRSNGHAQEAQKNQKSAAKQSVEVEETAAEWDEAGRPLLYEEQGKQQEKRNTQRTVFSRLRWSLACSIEPSLKVIGHQLLGIPVAIAVGLPAPYWPVPLVLIAISLVPMAWTAAIACGWMSRTDEAMLLDAASRGYAIGGGLVYSTAEVLNAVLADEPLKTGYAATCERVMQCAALSFRWDQHESCRLRVRELNGSHRSVNIHMGKQQLLRALEAAYKSGCKFVWCDTLSIPQPSADGTMNEARVAALNALLPAMTAVYASAQMVLVVETATGMQKGPNGYSSRTWTLQECVLNPNTSVVPLCEDEDAVPLDSDARLKLSGLADSAMPGCVRQTLSATDMADISAYKWVHSGEEQVAAAAVPSNVRQGFAAFAASRSASCCSDKQGALGQPYFRLLFPGQLQVERFFLELAWLCATERAFGKGSKWPMMLIDNTGWDLGTMSGSAASSRLFTGPVGYIQEGKQVSWHAEVLKTQDGCHGGKGWQMCLADMGLPAGRLFPVAFRDFCSDDCPRRESPSGYPVLYKLRTVTWDEMLTLRAGPREEVILHWD